MAYLSDIEIAQCCEMKHINEIAKKLDISDDYIEQYGKYKAKIDYNLLNNSSRENGKLILAENIANIILSSNGRYLLMYEGLVYNCILALIFHYINNFPTERQSVLFFYLL